MTEPRVPATEAGRALFEVTKEQGWYIQAFDDEAVVNAILAIEAEATATLTAQLTLMEFSRDLAEELKDHALAQLEQERAEKANETRIKREQNGMISALVEALDDAAGWLHARHRTTMIPARDCDHPQCKKRFGLLSNLRAASEQYLAGVRAEERERLRGLIARVRYELTRAAEGPDWDPTDLEAVLAASLEAVAGGPV